MKNNNWEIEIPEHDHGEGVDIMAIVGGPTLSALLSGDSSGASTTAA
jgi:hypothetical protein